MLFGRKERVDSMRRVIRRGVIREGEVGIDRSLTSSPVF